MKKTKRLKKGSLRKQRGRATKRSKAQSVPPMPSVLKKPEGDLGMMLDAMQDFELQAQVMAERAVKQRRKIVDWLRSRRLAGNIPIVDVAAAIGRHHTSLIRLETGVTHAKTSTLQKLLRYYGFDWMPTPTLFTSDPKAPKHRGE